jgi:hypothetical protein
MKDSGELFLGISGQAGKGWTRVSNLQPVGQPFSTWFFFLLAHALQLLN